MQTLSIDLETASSIDLGKAGVYRYTESPDFTVLLFGYSMDHKPVQVADLASGEQLPAEVFSALVYTAVTKTAFKATFERVCLSAWLRKYHPQLLNGAPVLGCQPVAVHDGVACIAQPPHEPRRRRPGADPASAER